MKRIKLSQEQYTIVDDDDFNRINRFSKWYANKDHKYNRYYAICHDPNNNKRIIAMHRFILDLKYGDRVHVDHINGNGLDNRKINLRICNHSQNQANCNIQSGTSQYKGVSYYKRISRYCASIRCNGNVYYLGAFTNEREAALAYDKKAKELFGDFAKTNF
jgi:hypothetical protein